MLLIVTNKEDAHADHVIMSLSDRNPDAKVVRLNTEDFATNIAFTSSGNDARVEVRDSGLQFSTQEVRTVWFRRPKDIAVDGIEDRDVTAFTRNQFDTVLRGLYFLTHDSAKWINSLPALHRARNKIQQLQLASKCGFRVPNTLISNVPADVAEFFNKHAPCVIKSLDEPHFKLNGQLFPIFTQLLESISDISDRLEYVANCPCLFQQFIRKQRDIRVVVFGDQIHAFSIHSQTNELARIDFRGTAPSNLQHDPIELPDAILTSISQFCAHQGLCFSAMDLVLDDDGEYFFLENNSNGQWLWLEHRTGVDLTGSLLQLFESPLAGVS